MASDDKTPDPRQGPLTPKGKEGLVVVENPPDAPLHMSPDEADISGIRLLDAARNARKLPGDHEDEEEPQ